MIDPKTVDFAKYPDGLVPTIVQDAESNEVLMLGYMNERSLQETIESRSVTFFSRSRNALWKKGETSGNTLELRSITADCDSDALLILATPKGPTCHRGTSSCFSKFDLTTLENLIQQRKSTEGSSSYTKSLFDGGLAYVAQKVGEESCEVIIAALSQSEERFLEECADLLYHFLVLLAVKGGTLAKVLDVLEQRSPKAT